MIDTYLKYGFGGAALLFFALGFVAKTHRFAWWIAAATAGIAGLSAHYDAFWVMVIMGLGSVAALCCTNSSVDLPWRAKVGTVVAIGLGAFLCVWPTLETLSDGKIKCPAYVKSKIDFRLVAGLDLRGGLRLVYTVDVEEAIKDKRDRYYDDMRGELATAYGFKASDKQASREDVAKVIEKVSLEKPRGDAATIVLKLKDINDLPKLGGAFEKRFTTEMVRFPGNAPGEFTYKIRTDVETRIRETAVNQAKDTIGKRVDELGLREAAVTTRDEDIIIEVPGQDESTFREIREIVSKTARLEFKLLDDQVDFFKDSYNVWKNDQSKFPAGLSFFDEQPPVGPGKTSHVTQAYLKKQPNETMKQAKARFREWLATLNAPTDHEFGLGLEHRTDEQGVSTEDGWRTYYLYGKAEITGDQIRDAQAQPDQGQRSQGGWYTAITFNEAGSVKFEEITGQNVQKRFAIILDDVVESAPRILGKIGGGHASITMGSGDVSKQLEDARKLELVLRSGALPAPITPSNEQRIGASLGSDSIRQGLYGALASAGLVLLFMAVYYHVAGVVADLAVIFNLFLQLSILATFGAAMTLPGIAGLSLTIGMAVDANVLINERIREELRAGKSPRSAVDLGYDKAFSAIIDGHMTTFIAGLILAQYGSGPIKGFAVTLLVGMVASLFTSVVCTRLCFDWWVRGRKVKTLDLGLAPLGQTMEIFKHGKYYDFMGMRTFWVSLSLILTLGSLLLVLIKGPNYGTDFKGGTEVELAFKKQIDVGAVREACVKAGFQHPDVVEVSDPTNPNRFLVKVQEVSALDDTKKAALATALCFQAEGAAPPPVDRCPEGMNATELKFSPGGDKVTLRYDHLPPIAKIASAMKTVPGVELRPGEGNPHVVSLRDNKVEVALKSKGDLLVDGLRQTLGADVAPESALRVEWVGPKAGKQLRDAAVKSVAIAIVFIMAYVAFRFDLRFAPGGILGLVHDSMVVIGVFVLLGKEITLSTIAAVLTIVGYSIADTVIVYDRIRENLNKHYGKSFAEIINISVSETLSRTILTSGSVLLSVSMFFIWGTGVIKDFALALVIGIIAGTYSSIYVAAPFTEWVDRRFFASADAAKKKKKRKFVAKPAGKREAVV